MFQYILTAADLFVRGFLFYWFMNRIGERRLNKVWIYPAAYGAFSAFCLLTQFSRSNWIITISIVLAVLFLETVLFKPTGAAYFYCVVYCFGFFLCQITSIYAVQWTYMNMTTWNLLRIGLEKIDNMQIVLLLIKWFAEFFWTFFILMIIKKDEEKENRFFLYKRQYFFFMLLPIFSVVFMLSIIWMSADFFVLRYGYGLVILNILLIFAINLLLLYLFKETGKGSRALREEKLYKQESELLYQHYKTLEESYQNSRKVIHDARNHMQAVARLYESGETDRAKAYAEDVFHLLNQTGHTWYTNNRMLNIILNEKLGQASMQDTRLELDICDGCLDRIREIDITTIFANLLDNAVEAIGEGEEKRLSLQIQNIHSFLVIKMVNSKGKKKERAGQKHQQLGLQNVKSALGKYDGTMKISQTDTEFQVSIMIPDEQKEM
ncbi:sensor histidine kinase [Blautia producta]|uniref:sensor histidine kinase n=1 Tax=Blautia producta TaxID=33035 RepID=UPI0031B59DD1